jgi:hypothetical protein
MKRVTFIPADSAKGKLTTEGGKGFGPPTLKDMQEYVEGYVEHLTVEVGGKRAHLFVNEDGRMKNLPLNERASAIYGRDAIFGNAILIEGFRDNEL